MSRAILYSVFLRFEEAIKDVTYTLKHQPNNKEVTDILVALEKKRLYEENLLKKMKNNLQRSVFFEKAKAFEAKKLFPSAIKNYREVIHLNNNDIEAKILLARVMALSGDENSAFKSYSNLRNDHPNNIEALLSEAEFLMNTNKYK